MPLSSFDWGGWTDPFRDIRRVQGEINRLLGERGGARAREYPPVNLWTGEEGVVVSAELAGVGPDDIDLTVQENTLTIRGERKPEATGADVAFHRRERIYGPFSRTIVLPYAVDAAKVEAHFHEGILMIRLPRPESEKPRRIAIQAK